jgi:hypothetical protein
MGDEPAAAIQAALKRQTAPVNLAMATVIAERNGWRLRSVVSQAALSGLYDRKSRLSREDAEAAYMEAPARRGASPARASGEASQESRGAVPGYVWIVAPVAIIVGLLVGLWKLAVEAIKSPIIAMTFIVLIALVITAIKMLLGS